MVMGVGGEEGGERVKRNRNKSKHPTEMSFLPPQFKDKNKTKPGSTLLTACFLLPLTGESFSSSSPLSPTENRRGSSFLCRNALGLGDVRFHREQMGQSLSHGHLFAGGVQGVPGTGGV